MSAKRTVLTLFVAAFFLSLSLSVVLAQEASSSPNTKEYLEQLRETRKEKIEALRENRSEKIEKLKEKRLEVREKIATKQAQLKEKSVSRIKEIFKKMLERHKAALERLDKIAEKIASRIDKLKEKGVDTSKAEKELAEAELLGSDAEAAIDSALFAVEAIDPSSNSPKEAVVAAKGAVESSREALKKYHKALVEAIRELKASQALRGGT